MHVDDGEGWYEDEWKCRSSRFDAKQDPIYDGPLITSPSVNAFRGAGWLLFAEHSISRASNMHMTGMRGSEARKGPEIQSTPPKTFTRRQQPLFVVPERIKSVWNAKNKDDTGPAYLE